MNNRLVLLLLNLLVLVLIGGVGFGFYTVYQKQQATMVATVEDDAYAYLTTRELSSLPALPETIKIVPTGKTQEFKLEAKESPWEVMPGVKVEAMTYNGTSPGQTLRVTEGDLVKVTLKNSLKTATSIHFHGMHLPNKQDGVPPFTQEMIQPGETFTYEFIAGHAGTYMYHPHINSVEQIDAGLYGVFIIDPQDNTNQPKFDKEYTMMFGGWNIPSDSYDPSVLTGLGGHEDMEGMETMQGMDKSEEDEDNMSGMDMGKAKSGGMAMDYNFWTINGKAFPATEKLKVNKGERVRIRLINISNLAHPMHLHGTDFRIIAEDSHPLAQPKVVNTINVAPGKTFDIELIADNAGEWVFHCHELHHTENDGVEPGGIMTTIVVSEGASKETKSTKATEESSKSPMKIMQH